MLRINPDERLSALECIKSRAFDSIRDPECEKPCKKPIDLNFMDSAGMYDYEFHKNPMLKLEDCVAHIDKVIHKFRKHATKKS